VLIIVYTIRSQSATLEVTHAHRERSAPVPHTTVMQRADRVPRENQSVARTPLTSNGRHQKCRRESLQVSERRFTATTSYKPLVTGAAATSAQTAVSRPWSMHHANILRTGYICRTVLSILAIRRTMQINSRPTEIIIQANFWKQSGDLRRWWIRL